MSDLTNPNAARLRMCLGDETVEGSLGASSAGQGDVTTSALATPPPLDLTALRERAAKEVRRMKSGEWSSGVSLSGMTLNALLDRLEASEAEASKYRGLYDEAESAHTDTEAKLARVREVHRAKETQQMRYRNTENGNSSRYWVNVQMCSGCSADYPCPTIRALGGAE